MEKTPEYIGSHTVVRSVSRWLGGGATLEYVVDTSDGPMSLGYAPEDGNVSDILTAANLKIESVNGVPFEECSKQA